MKSNKSRLHQRGGILLVIIIAVAALSALSIIGNTLFTVLIGGSQRSSLNITTGQSLTQAAYTLTTEANKSGSYPIAVAPTAWSGTTPSVAPAIGTANAVGLIPAISAAPKVDAWSSNIGYCTFAAAAQGDPVFAIISAGPDKIFQTTCTQAFATLPQGDDGVRAKSAANVSQGVGGTVYYGDPVATYAALIALTSVHAGEQRFDIADQLTYTNPTGTPGAGGWVINQSLPTVVAGADCAAYPVGALGKDALGNTYNCM